MRTILLLCFLIVTTAVKAQFMGFGHHWVAGCYYDLEGKKTTGLLSEYIKEPSLFDGPEKYFLFKENKDSAKIKVLAKNVRSFVAERDSFVISNSKILNETPFIQVIIDKQTKLYVARLPRQTPGFGVMSGAGAIVTSIGVSFSYTKNKYYYGESPDSITQVKRKNFVEVMSKIMADKPEAVAKIKNETFTFGYIDNLIDFYLTGKMPKQDDENDE